MHSWLAAWSEFEALNALASYAFEHPVAAGTNAWPELLPPEHPPLYTATALGHPLLPGAVTNDVALGEQHRFFLISGSNMSGKSTLLRSVGINAVLAYAGAPVRARSLRLTPLVLGASLALTDSLAEGTSKFKAEVARLSALVAAGRQAPCSFWSTKFSPAPTPPIAARPPPPSCALCLRRAASAHSAPTTLRSPNSRRRPTAASICTWQSRPGRPPRLRLQA